MDDTGGPTTGWPLSIESTVEEDKSIVRPGGHYPYEWDASMSQTEAVANAWLIAAAPALLDGVRKALGALNAMPRRTLPEGDSYQLAVHLEALIKQATEGSL